MGILFENISYLYNLKFWYVFHVEVPVFANASYNMGDPKINIKTIEDRNFKQLFFLDITLKP